MEGASEPAQSHARWQRPCPVPLFERQLVTEHRAVVQHEQQAVFQQHRAVVRRERGTAPQALAKPGPQSDIRHVIAFIRRIDTYIRHVIAFIRDVVILVRQLTVSAAELSGRLAMLDVAI